MRYILVLLLLIGTGLLLGGPFTNDVAAQAAVPPVLWGVDEDDNELFSVADYTQISAGAAAGFTNHGRLRYDRGNGNIVDLPLVVSPGGNITGGHIGSMALAPDGVAYMALNAGLEFDDSTANLGAPVLLKFDTANATPAGILDVVEIIGQINIPGFNEEVNADNISGLSFDPVSGDLYALYRVGSKQFSPGDDQLLIVSPEDATIDPVFGLKLMTGLGEVVRDGEDLEFDTAGNLYVTDDQDDHLYRIDKSTAEIAEVVDNDESGGLSGSGRTKIEALAWDPELNQMVAVATLRQLFYIQTLQNGANVPLGGLAGLTDVEALDFIIPVVDTPAIDIRKEAEGPDSRTVNSGDDVTFEIEVTNPSGVELTDVVVTDALTPTCDNTIGTLAAGANFVYSCTAPAVVLAFTNEACVDGTGNGAPVNDCDSSTVEIANPSIDIEKATNGQDADDANAPGVPQIAAGDTVTWTFVVTNNGDVIFNENDVVVTDDTIGPVTNIVDKGNGGVLLSPGEVWIYEVTGKAADLSADPAPAGVTIVDGCNPDGTTGRPTYENLGMVTVPGATDSDLSHYCNPLESSIDIRKEAEGPDSRTVNSGDDVTFEIEVTNTSGVELTDVVVTDALTPTCDNNIGTLAAGANFLYSCTAPAVVLAFTNEACVDGTGNGAPVNDCDSSTVEIDAGGEPAVIDIEKWTRIGVSTSCGDVCDKKGKLQQLTMLYTGENVLDHTQDDGKVNVSGDPESEAEVRIIAAEKADGTGAIYFDGLVNLGERFVIDGTRAKLGSKTFVSVYDQNDVLLQTIEFHTSCSQPLELGDQFGSIQLIDVTVTDKGGKSDDDRKSGDRNKSDGNSKACDNRDDKDDDKDGKRGDKDDDKDGDKDDKRGDKDDDKDGKRGDKDDDKDDKRGDNRKTDDRRSGDKSKADGSTNADDKSYAKYSKAGNKGEADDDGSKSDHEGKSGDGNSHSDTPGPAPDFGVDADAPSGPEGRVGDEVTWTYFVTGSAPLENVLVVDDNGTPGETSDDFNPDFVRGDDNGDNILDPGETWLYQAKGRVKLGQYANIGAVSGVGPDGTAVMDEDPSHYIGVTPPVLAARITGGGWRVKDSKGNRIRSSGGFTLHCDIELSNNLQINWQKRQKWHINKLVDAAFCKDDPEYTPGPPTAPADTYFGLDVGKLNNQHGSVACFKLEDHGERANDPDGPDQALIRIWDVGFDPGISAEDLDDPGFDCLVSVSDPTTDPNTVLYVPESDIQGNFQFHEDQPHKNKKREG